MVKKRRVLESSKPSNDWIVTFSDCMTLLLCFFVMLLSFSSFDEVTFENLSGMFKAEQNTSISTTDLRKLMSVVEPIPRPNDVTDKGSEKATDEDPRRVKNPKIFDVLPGDDAYKDRRTFYIPRNSLFYANGVAMRGSGKSRLRKIATFLKALPCRVVVAESGGDSSGVGLQRAWAVCRTLRESGLRYDLFSVSARSSRDAQWFDNEPYLEITLLSPAVMR